jgi:hypothetical protein
MILTFSEARLLLQHLIIPSILQEKILLLFLSYGTPSANIIKTECLKLNSISHYNDNVKTLWRLKLYNSNYSTTIKKYYNKPNISQYELSIATFYPYPESNMVNNQLINIVIKSYLYYMFYNLDKFYYGEYGTLTANIIRNAITNNTIKCSK